MDEKLKELEALLAERRAIMTLIGSTGEYGIGVMDGTGSRHVLKLKSINPDIQTELAAFKQAIAADLISYRDQINQKIKDKATELLAI